MSISQRRSGPMSIGIYGLTAPFINAFLLLISTLQYPKSAVILLLLLSPFIYIVISFSVIILIYPLFNTDLSLSFIMIILLLTLSELFLIFSSLSSSSKYSILGSIRIIGIIIAFELILSTSYFIIISTSLSLQLSIHYFHLPFMHFIPSAFVVIVYLPHSFHWVPIAHVLIIHFISHYSFGFMSIRSYIGFIVISMIVLICILVESNRQPFDLSEAESELIAGFLTDHSSILYLLLLLTEYANIVFLIVLFLIIYILSHL